MSGRFAILAGLILISSCARFPPPGYGALLLLIESARIASQPCSTCFVFLTNTLHNGDFDHDASLGGNADGSGIPEADKLCNTDSARPNQGSYKALLADNARRRGSLSSNAGDSKIDWVFGSSKPYIRATDSVTIFTSSATGIFLYGLAPGTFSSGATLYYTGLDLDWTTDLSTCTSWTSTGGNGRVGSGTNQDDQMISFSNSPCNNTRSIACVEQ